MRRVASWALLVLCLLAAISGSAQAQTRVVVRKLDGAFATRTRDLVVAELKDNSVEVVDNSDADAAAKEAGVDLDSASGRVAVAKSLQINGFVEGSADRSASRVHVALTLYSGQDGSELKRLKFAAPPSQLKKIAHARVWKAFGPELENAKPPSAAPPEEEKPMPALTPTPDDEPEPAPAEAEKTPAPEPEDEEADDKGERPSPFDLSLGAHISTRRFTYNDAFPGLRGYKLGMSPKLALLLHWYPAAHFTSGFAANLGLEWRFEMLVGVSSKNTAGDKFDTTSSELGFGLRWRIPLDRDDELGVVAGYGLHTFSLGKAKGVGSGVPDVDYGFVRLGADLRLALFGPLSGIVRGAFLLGLSQGQIASSQWFPHTSQNGVEAELGAGVRFAKPLELQVLGTVQRYFMTFDPRATDPSVITTGHVAGGALDQYFAVRAVAVLRL